MVHKEKEKVENEIKRGKNWGKKGKIAKIVGVLLFAQIKK